MNSLQKFLLASIYCNNLANGNIPSSILPYLVDKIDLGVEFYFKQILILEEEGFVNIIHSKSNENDVKYIRCNLTELGRSRIKVVLVGGVFDLLHVGHIYTLKSAKSYGDVLIVVVATDLTIVKSKKNRKIFHDEKSRQELVSSVRFVDLAVVGRESTLYDTVEHIKPDIIALGYDQSHDAKEIQKNCLNRGLKINVIRMSSPVPQMKSSLIKKELGSSFYDI